MSVSVAAAQPEFLIPAGDWSGWLVAVGTLLVVVVGAVQWRRDRQHSLDLQRRAQTLQESEQASRVSGLLKVVTGRPEGDVLQILVLNTSELPILDVTASFEGIVETRPHESPLKQPVKLDYNIPEPYILPRATHEVDTMTITGGPGSIVDVHQRSVTVRFQDANGIRWQKVTGRPPEKL